MNTCECLNGLNVTIVKKVTRVIIEDIDKKNKLFAKKYAENYDTKEAYNFAYFEIQEVRASVVLQDTSVWDYILTEIAAKAVKTANEEMVLRRFDKIVEIFSLTPFEIYNVFVEEFKVKRKTGTLASLMNVECCTSFSALVYIHAFFTLLNREMFTKKTREVLKKELEIMQSMGKSNEIKFILKNAAKDGVYFDIE